MLDSIHNFLYNKSTWRIIKYDFKTTDKNPLYPKKYNYGITGGEAWHISPELKPATC